MLDSLMRPAPGAAPVLDLSGMLAGRAPAASLGAGPGSAAAAAAPGTGLPGRAASEGSMGQTGQGVRGRPDPARSLMGAIAKGVLLQQQKEKLQAQVRRLTHATMLGRSTLVALPACWRELLLYMPQFGVCLIG